MAGGSGSVAASAATVTTSATLIVGGRTSREAVQIQNLGAADIYIGGSGVTASTGIKVASGASWDDQNLSGPLYGITSSGTADVRVLEVY